MTATHATNTDPVSIVLYVYNGARYLGELLDSIAEQAHRNWELCVVDDGSTDATPEILADFATTGRCVRIERQENQGIEGLHRTFNTALAMTRHDLIAIANADDVWRTDKLARQVDAFRSDASLDICTHDATFVDGCGRVIHGGFRQVPSPLTGPPPRPWQFIYANPVPNPTVMFRRSILRLVGLQEFGRQHDHQFWFKATVAGCRFLDLPNRLIHYRLHDDSVSTAAEQKPRIAVAHRESASLMVERHDLHALVPELLLCRDDDESEAWARCFLATTAWSADNFTVAELLWAEALAMSTNAAIMTGLGMAALHREDTLAAGRLLRIGADGGSPAAAVLLDDPQLLVHMPPPVWIGAQPAVAKLVERGDAGELEWPSIATIGVPDVVLACNTTPEVDELVGALRTAFEHRGRSAMTLTILAADAKTIDAIVVAHGELQVGDPDLVDAMAIEVSEVSPGALSSVVEAFLLEGAEVVELRNGALVG